MNDATKQKLAIAGAAVFVLGAGVYLWPGDRSEPLDTSQPNQPVRVVRTLVEPQDPDRIKRQPAPEPPESGRRIERTPTKPETGVRDVRKPVRVEKRPKKDPPKHAA